MQPVDEIIALGLKDALKDAGFKKSGRTWHARSDDRIKVIDVQLDKHNTADDQKFTINLGVHFPAVAAALGDAALERPEEWDCHARVRIHQLFPSWREWWTVPPPSRGRDRQRLAKAVSDTVTQRGLPWLAAVSLQDLCDRGDGGRYLVSPDVALAAAELTMTAEGFQAYRTRLAQERRARRIAQRLESRPPAEWILAALVKQPVRSYLFHRRKAKILERMRKRSE
jgi:hypothetical protein